MIIDEEPWPDLPDMDLTVAVDPADPSVVVQYTSFRGGTLRWSDPNSDPLADLRSFKETALKGYSINFQAKNEFSKTMQEAQEQIAQFGMRSQEMIEVDFAPLREALAEIGQDLIPPQPPAPLPITHNGNYKQHGPGRFTVPFARRGGHR